ncbi:glycosyltransferase family 4 protein, partial [Chloroflexota bacterium]
MNFVFICIGIFSSKAVTGGDTIFIEIGKRLVRDGNHVTILTSKSGEVMFRGKGLDVNFWTITRDERTSETGLVSTIFILPIRMLRAALLLRKKNISQGTVVVAYTDLIFDLFPMLFVRDRKVKRVSPFFQIMPNPFKGYRGIFTGKLKVPNLRETVAYLQQWFSVLCLKYTCDIIFSLRNIQYFLTDRGIPEKKIMGFSPGIDWSAVNCSVADEKRYDACWMGRYHTMKGCDDLIRIWELVCKERNEASLAIMGSASKRLEPLIKEKHLEQNIKVLGFVDDETKFRTMKESKVLLFPSYYESWGMIISEAMACGLPAIVYDLPIYQDIYPKGIVKVAIGNREAFASETIRLLTEKEMRQKLSKEAEQ